METGYLQQYADTDSKFIFRALMNVAFVALLRFKSVTDLAVGSDFQESYSFSSASFPLS